MKALSQTALNTLLARPAFQSGNWTCRTERNPVQLGEYGRLETYSHNGRAVFALQITFNPPKGKAFLL